MLSLRFLGFACLTASLLLGAGEASAQRKPRNAATERQVAQTPDDAVVQARQANADSSRERLGRLTPLVPETHPLQSYLPYWDLRMRLAEDKLGEGREAGALDLEVQGFLSKHGKSLVADLLRRDWLLNLGKRREWTLFDTYYSGWVLRDDTRVFCLNGQSVLAKAGSANQLQGQAGFDEAITALNETRALGSECGDFLDGLAKTGVYKRGDVLKRLVHAIEDNSPDSIRRSAATLGLDPAAVDMALNRPAKIFELKWGQELAMIAIARVARQEPESAAVKIESLQSSLGAQASGFAWAQVAAAGMRKLMPEALEWSRKSLSAPALPGMDDSLVWMARAALRAQEWKLLSSAVSRMPNDLRQDPTWVYWQARSLKAAKRNEEADGLLKSIAGQFHFYGQLAAEDLGQLTNIPSAAATISETELAEARGNAGFARALKFYELGLRPEGNREWNYQLRGMSDRQLLAAAQFACQKSVLDRCVNTADRTVAEHDFSLRFVSPFKEQLVKEAQERNLDPAWVYGLIRQESRFIMDARSSVGASGLMQIMPATGRWIAKQLGASDFKVEQLNDMGVNLRFGTFYLKSVLDDLDSSPAMASAAYNAGPNRPRQWRVNLPGQVEGAIFAEIIPFTETRDYVKKVLSNSTYYAALFSGKPQSLKARLGMVAPRALSQSELP